MPIQIGFTRGTDPAIIDSGSGRITSHASLQQDVDVLLEHLGPHRQLLLVEATPTLSTIMLYFTAWIGRHVVILCPPDRPDDLARMAERFRPDAIAAGSCDDAISRLIPNADRDHGPIHPDLALLLPTSGSTGAAKAVRLSRDNLLANARSIVEYLGIGDDERALLNLPIHYSYGLSVLNSHLLAGASVILDSRSMIDPGLWADAERLGATSFAGVPYSYELLDQVDLATHAPSTLRYFTQAGGRLPPERASRYGALARERGWRFFVMYGQTEATARMAYLPPELLENEPDAIGRAIPGGEFSLRDEEGNVIETTETAGELIYSGPNVMMGYASERSDLALPPQPSVLATGDMAVRAASGLYRITGRKSRFVKIFGNRIDLDEVERMLERENIHAIATGTDERLIVVTTSEEGCADILTVLSRALKLPADRIATLALADPPRLASGKIDYPQLRALVDERSPIGAPSTARGGTAVREAFEKAFGKDGPDDAASFLSLGGDSLTYVSMAIALEDHLGVLPDGWEAMTVGELADLADRAAPRANATPARPLIQDNLDTIRGIACLLVVAFHVVGVNPSTGLRLPMSSGWHVVMDSIDFVRMPLFTAMAGYFYALMPSFHEPLGKFITRKARSLLIPSLFVGLIMWLSRATTGVDQDPLINALMFGFMHLWYLNALFVVFLAVALLEHRGPMSPLLGGTIGLLAIPGSMLAYQHEAYFTANFLYLLPYFIFGIGMRRIPAQLYNRTTIIGGALLGAVTLCLELYWRSSPVSVPLFEPVLVLIAGLAIVPPLFQFVPRIRAFARIGAYSITIYLWHPITNGATRAVVSRAHPPEWFLFLAGMAAGVGLPIILHRIVQRWPRISLPMIGR